MKLYEQLVTEVEGLVDRGVLLPGEKIPSVRQASRNHQVSITTVIRAYVLLESRGVIESRPQSGYYVRPQPGASPAALCPSRPPARPSHVDVSTLVLSTLRSIRSNDAVPLGSPYPDRALFPWQRINRYCNNIARRYELWSLLDVLPPGCPELVRQIARRYLDNGLVVDPNEIVVTIGATEAINLCLEAVAKPGDTIAVESPTYYAMLHAIERLGMRAVEVATDPLHGIDIAALASLIDGNHIAACMVMPNFQNPLGFQMPEENKRQLVKMLTEKDIPVIESDVYGELYYGDSRPSTLKDYDMAGIVLHCSSFSKTLTNGFRIGWALPGRYRQNVERLKFLDTLTTPAIPQLAIAEFLKNDGFDIHLRRIRKAYAQQASIMAAAVRRFFPPGTRTSQPAGGYVLWIELPEGVDAMDLYNAALGCGITIAPGHIFSPEASFRHCVRLNYSAPWSPKVEAAVVTLGKLVASLQADTVGAGTK
ncbi:putative DNA-binding transcriptional regulator fused with a domain with PLP-binding motif (plasmid) [Cupriavidus taiwanensis]|uniref:Putative DNA-binding transcriptional regulator fused with a domain with PLP-binding motif n=1 Tax=Cupriavidus taiwanensis TaxID=164546 RepID=A0A375IRY6_9BURK|nr:PLP-dependent aminotransferase family protein [Cupriavidus taiwanensis]SPK75975.1 putative DNA-binding transcriptional regulator fused with a domain with PLP-binding motif [Cupriavidus taiwanensis]